MKFAVSNIALTAFDHGDEIIHLAELGLSGLEVAPSRVWRNTWQGLRPSMVESYRKQVDAAGLTIVGLHSLFYDHPELGLFKDPEKRAATMDFLEHLSGLCRDLGGRTLIYGGGRKRGDMVLEDAFDEAIGFFKEICMRVETHGTCFCFEPLSREDSDFINSVDDSIRIVEAVDHPALRVQLDAKALVANDEVNVEVFAAAMPYLVHMHANEPNLGILGSTGRVDHARIGDFLRSIDYDGFVSIEQKMVDGTDPLDALRQSSMVLAKNYS